MLVLTNTHVGKIKIIRKQNFKGEANNTQLDNRDFKQIATAGANTAAGIKFLPK